MTNIDNQGREGTAIRRPLRHGYPNYHVTFPRHLLAEGTPLHKYYAGKTGKSASSIRLTLKRSSRGLLEYSAAVEVEGHLKNHLRLDEVSA